MESHIISDRSQNTCSFLSRLVRVTRDLCSHDAATRNCEPHIIPASCNRPPVGHFRRAFSSARAPSTGVACGLLLDVRDWLWRLTMNTGELKKCERHHFTDSHWAQFEEAGLLPGPRDYERRWMWEFHAFYFWYLTDKMSEDGWS